MFKPIGNKATRRRLMSPRSRTGCVAEDCRRSCRQRRPACPVRHAPCAACTCFFLRARRNPTGVEKRAAHHAVHRALREHLRSRTGRRCSPAPSRTHAEAQANNAHFAHSHIHTHTRTHTHTKHTRTHTRTHARTHTHTHQYISLYVYIYI